MYFNYRGINIHYECIGEGIPFFMIHGFECDKELMKGCMEPVMEKYNGYKRIYIDLPGMGKSESASWISSSNSILDMLCEFISVIVAGEKFMIAGESYGGYLTRGILSRFTDRVYGMFLICPLILSDYSKMDISRSNLKFMDDKFYEENKDDEDFKEFMKNAVIVNEYTYERYKNEILCGLKIADSKFLNQLSRNYRFPFDVDEKVQNMRFDQPVTILCGRQDNSVGYRDLLKISEDYKRCSISVVDMAGHNLQIERPEVFNLELEDFLKRVEIEIEEQKAKREGDYSNMKYSKHRR